MKTFYCVPQIPRRIKPKIFSMRLERNKLDIAFLDILWITFSLEVFFFTLLPDTRLLVEDNHFFHFVICTCDAKDKKRLQFSLQLKNHVFVS